MHILYVYVYVHVYAYLLGQGVLGPRVPVHQVLGVAVREQHLVGLMCGFNVCVGLMYVNAWEGVNMCIVNVYYIWL
jgi:hypothetical protein